MSNEQSNAAATLRKEILAAIEKFEEKTGIAVRGFSRDWGWSYINSDVKIETRSMRIDYETRG